MTVCGVHSKFQTGILEQYVLDIDCVCLNETKTDYISKDNLIDLTPLTMKSKSRKHKYGGIHGLCILVKG